MSKKLLFPVVLVYVSAVLGAGAAESNLYVAASENDTNAIAACLADGIKINALENNRGCSALHLAASLNRKDAAKYLLERGADINGRDHTGKTPLHYAALNDQYDMVEMLLWNKAEVNALDIQGLTPLHLAAQYGHAKIIKLLLNYGADISVKTNYRGLTPLHWAAFWGDTEAINALLDNGADINARDSHGYTPFIWAEQNGCYEAARLLARKGCKQHPHDRILTVDIRPSNF